MINDDLLILAKEARNFAYAPVSGFKVGAALLAKSGKIYTGCNIENQGIMSICAERVAFCKAISEGEKEFEKMLVIGGKAKEKLESTTPCGYCRQFISEFVNPDFKIISYDAENCLFREFTMSELLPYGFEY